MENKVKIDQKYEMRKSCMIFWQCFFYHRHLGYTIIWKVYILKVELNIVITVNIKYITAGH